MEVSTMEAIMAGGAATFAVLNRQTELRSKIATAIGKFYHKASPSLEHFFYGFAVTTGGYALSDMPQAMNFVLEQYPHAPVEHYGAIFGTAAIGSDIIWESKQAIERKKIKPEQLIGTCIGALAGYLLCK